MTVSTNSTEKRKIWSSVTNRSFRLRYKFDYFKYLSDGSNNAFNQLYIFYL